jgi:hypothetical protein
MQCKLSCPRPTKYKRQALDYVGHFQGLFLLLLPVSKQLAGQAVQHLDLQGITAPSPAATML